MLEMNNKFEKPSWCPLREVPEKKDPILFEPDDYYRGYNDCLDDILGGENDVHTRKPN